MIRVGVAFSRKRSPKPMLQTLASFFCWKNCTLTNTNLTLDIRHAHCLGLDRSRACLLPHSVNSPIFSRCPKLQLQVIFSADSFNTTLMARPTQEQQPVFEVHFVRLLRARLPVRSKQARGPWVPFWVPDIPPYPLRGLVWWTCGTFPHLVTHVTGLRIPKPHIPKNPTRAYLMNIPEKTLLRKHHLFDEKPSTRKNIILKKPSARRARRLHRGVVLLDNLPHMEGLDNSFDAVRRVGLHFRI